MSLRFSDTLEIRPYPYQEFVNLWSNSSLGQKESLILFVI